MKIFYGDYNDERSELAWVSWEIKNLMEKNFNEILWRIFFILTWKINKKLFLSLIFTLNLIFSANFFTNYLKTPKNNQKLFKKNFKLDQRNFCRLVWFFSSFSSSNSSRAIESQNSNTKKFQQSHRVTIWDQILFVTLKAGVELPMCVYWILNLIRRERNFTCEKIF